MICYVLCTYVPCSTYSYTTLLLGVMPGIVRRTDLSDDDLKVLGFSDSEIDQQSDDELCATKETAQSFIKGVSKKHGVAMFQTARKVIRKVNLVQEIRQQMIDSGEFYEAPSRTRSGKLLHNDAGRPKKRKRPVPVYGNGTSCSSRDCFPPSTNDEDESRLPECAEDDRSFLAWYCDEGKSVEGTPSPFSLCNHGTKMKVFISIHNGRYATLPRCWGQRTKNYDPLKDLEDGGVVSPSENDFTLFLLWRLRWFSLFLKSPNDPELYHPYLLSCCFRTPGTRCTCSHYWPKIGGAKGRFNSYSWPCGCYEEDGREPIFNCEPDASSLREAYCLIPNGTKRYPATILLRSSRKAGCSKTLHGDRKGRRSRTVKAETMQG